MGRGGGPTNRAILAQPPESVGGRLAPHRAGRGHHQPLRQPRPGAPPPRAARPRGAPDQRQAADQEPLARRAPGSRPCTSSRPLAERAYRDLVHETPRPAAATSRRRPRSTRSAGSTSAAGRRVAGRTGERRRAARHPLGLRLDAEPGHPARLVRLRQRALQAWAGEDAARWERPRHHVPRVALLPDHGRQRPGLAAQGRHADRRGLRVASADARATARPSSRAPRAEFERTRRRICRLTGQQRPPRRRSPGCSARSACATPTSIP